MSAAAEDGPAAGGEGGGGAPSDEARSGGGNPRARGGARRLLLGLVLVVAGFTGGLCALRFLAATGPGRAAVTRALDGLALGSAGRIHLSGLRGDPFSRFSLDRLQIVDDRGIWLEADDVAVDWRPSSLLVRTVRIRSLSARRLALLRLPQAPRSNPSSAVRLPVNLDLDEAHVGLETGAAVSVRPGRWNVEGSAIVRRSGRIRLRLAAASLLRAGDGLRLDLRLGERTSFSVAASAREATGGALAGLLGLPADQALSVTVSGSGSGASGSASALVTSGARPVVSGSGAWTARGGHGAATADLSLSRLTRFAAERLGSRADAVVTATPLPGGLFSINASVKAQLGSASLAGPVDLSTRDLKGVLVHAEVPLLARWLPFPAIGAATLSGRAQGRWGDFSLSGGVQARDLRVLGYSIARAAGPLSVAYGREGWRIGGDLAGSGAAAPGLAGALIGAAPRAKFDLSVLRTGHFLFRSLLVRGAALTLDATGGQGLFGGLTFKGSLLAPDLARARPGLHGRLSAEFHADADAGAGGRAWKFDFTSGSQGFSSGSSDLDHFLGSRPALAGKGAYAWTSGLTLSETHLVGAAVGMDAHGSVAADGALGLDATWRAQGPFDAGPLVIQGLAHGTGRITGKLAAPKADLVAELTTLDLGPLVLTPARVNLQIAPAPGGAAGAFEVAGRSAQGAAHGKAEFLASGGAFSLRALSFDAGGARGSGDIAFAGGRLLSADLSGSAGPGLLLDAGQARAALQLTGGSGGGGRARFTLEGEGLALPGAPVVLRTLSVRGDGALAALPVSVALAAVRPEPVTFTGRGTLAVAPAGTSLSLEGAGRIRKSAFRTLEPLTVRMADKALRASAALSIAGGEARLDFQSEATGAQGRILARNLEVEALDPDFTGAVSGEAELSGSGGRLSGRMTADLQKLRSRDLPASEALSGPLQARIDNGRLLVSGSAANGEGLKAAGEADLPVEASAAPFHISVDPTKPIRGSFKVDGEVRPLWDVLAGGERSLSGQLDASAQLSGTVSRPVLLGSAALAKGAFRDEATGLSLVQLEINSTFGADDLTIRRLSGSDGHGGTIAGEGRVGLSESAASTFTIAVKRFQLLDSDLGRASASGTLVATHPARGEGKLSGELTIDRADFVAAPPTPSGVVPMDVLEINRAERPLEDERPAPAAAGPPITLDVALRAPRGIYVRGRGLNVELSLDARVGGNITRPLLSGVARVVSGSYDFAGKRFDVGSSGTIRLASDPADIRLDLSATWEDPTITALVRVQGTAAKPDIKLTSIPVLPQDEVLARVLFGVSASQLSAAQGAEMASALASITGGGGFDVIGNLRQFAGLDRLALGSTLSSTTTISGGKYISKDVYLELTGGARNGTGAQVEWRIRKNLALVSRYGAALDPRYPNDTDASLSVRFRTDF